MQLLRKFATQFLRHGHAAAPSPLPAEEVARPQTQGVVIPFPTAESQIEQPEPTSAIEEGFGRYAKNSKLTKKVTRTNPKCPSGYKQKA